MASTDKIPTEDLATMAEPRSEEDLALPPTHDAPASARTSHEISDKMGECCVKQPETAPQDPVSGERIKLANIDCYISRPPPTSTSPAPLLLFLPNAIGVPGSNNQLTCDHFAREGYFVLMPDLFNGDAFVMPPPDETEVSAGTSLLSTVKTTLIEGVKKFFIDMWLARHTPETTEPIIRAVLTAVKDTYGGGGDPAYVPSLGTYVVGYCYGGKYALRMAGRLGKELEDEGVTSVAAVGVAHPTLVTVKEFEEVRKPVTLACVDQDPYCADEIREEGRKLLEKNRADAEYKLFKGIPHGFGVYGSYPEQDRVEAQKKAFDQFVSFFVKN